MAGEAAFFAALAVFPALLTVVAVVRVFGSVLGPTADRDAVSGLTRLLRVVLTTRGTAAADAATSLLGASSGGVLTVGTGVALFLLARALRSVLYALSVIADGAPRRLWPAAVALAVVTLLGAAAVIAAAVTDPLGYLRVPAAETVWAVLRWPVGLAALLAWAALLLRVGTGRRVGWRPAPGARRALLVGAAITAAGWVGASLLLPLYVAVVGRLTATIGALGGGLILLLWLYLLMLALYLAAEVLVTLSPHCRPARSRPT